MADMLMIIVTPTANPLENNHLEEIIDIESKLDFVALVPLQLQTILTETPQKKPIWWGLPAPPGARGGFPVIPQRPPARFYKSIHVLVDDLR
ncbi:MAG: hypothetical protein LH470_06640 [Lysobacter sp.]|nr:hypothetical protein [Lysobacter sp.]